MKNLLNKILGNWFNRFRVSTNISSIDDIIKLKDKSSLYGKPYISPNEKVTYNNFVTLHNALLLYFNNDFKRILESKIIANGTNFELKSGKIHVWSDDEDEFIQLDYYFNGSSNYNFGVHIRYPFIDGKICDLNYIYTGNNINTLHIREYFRMNEDQYTSMVAYDSKFPALISGCFIFSNIKNIW